MFVVHCPWCRRRMLCGAHQVRAVHNLAPGVIAVELTCLRGHPMTVLTGRSSVAS